MNLFQATVLGMLQGLTEFLPVSSSGHLVLLQNLFGLTEPELMFDISLHMGTLVATCVVFFQEIKAIVDTLLHLPALIRTSGPVRVYRENREVRLAVLIVVGSIPTAVLGILFHEVADRIFSSVRVVGFTLLITGMLLWLTRHIPPGGRRIPGMTLKDSLTIGLAQGIAILPGISRSGSTICTALFLKIDREVAGRYSFLLSIPAMLGALVMGLRSDTISHSVTGANLALGTATSAVVGFIALKILLHVVKQGHLYRFAPYCWLVGSLTLISSLL
jgi:undecaprenyl-diphosphatase